MVAKICKYERFFTKRKKRPRISDVGWLLSKVQNPKFEIHTWKRGLAVRARRSTDNNPNPTLLIHYPILACETPTGSIIFYPRSERANAGLCAAGLTVSVDLLLYWVGGNSCGRLFQRG